MCLCSMLRDETPQTRGNMTRSKMCCKNRTKTEERTFRESTTNDFESFEPVVNNRAVRGRKKRQKKVERRVYLLVCILSLALALFYNKQQEFVVFQYSAGRASPSTTTEEAGARNAAVQPSASTTGEEASGRSAADRASPSTTTEEAGARNAAVRVSPSTTVKEAGARNAAGRASASTTAKDTRPSNAGGRASASTTA
jgi:cytoskeletal protein RodZ